MHEDQTSRRQQLAQVMLAVAFGGPNYATNRIVLAERAADRRGKERDQARTERDQARTERDELATTCEAQAGDMLELKTQRDSLAGALEQTIADVEKAAREATESADRQARATQAEAAAIDLVWQTAPAALTLEQARRRASLIAFVATDEELSRY